MKKIEAKYRLATRMIEDKSYSFGDSRGKSWYKTDLKDLEAAFELLHTRGKHFPRSIADIAGQLRYLKRDNWHDDDDVAELERVRDRVVSYCEKHEIEINDWN